MDGRPSNRRNKAAFLNSSGVLWDAAKDEIALALKFKHEYIQIYNITEHLTNLK